MNLVSVMVAMGIVGIFAGIVTQAFRNNLDATGRVADRASAEELRQYIRMGLDCDATKAATPASCAASRLIALKRTGTSTIDLVQIPTGNKYTAIGNYSLKAYCTGAALTYNVDFASTPKNPRAAIKWETLFKIPIVCK
jgi:Tfp pilus assembly protein PilE